jgi:hypothetical protein
LGRLPPPRRAPTDDEDEPRRQGDPTWKGKTVAEPVLWPSPAPLYTPRASARAFTFSYGVLLLPPPWLYALSSPGQISAPRPGPLPRHDPFKGSLRSARITSFSVEP